MSGIRYLVVLVAVALTAGQAPAADCYPPSGCFDPNACPGDVLVIGTLSYPDVTVTICSGTHATVGSIEIANHANGTLIIESGASLVAGSVWVGYKGGCSYTATLDVQGQLTIDSSLGLQVGGVTSAEMAIGADANVDIVNGSANFGMDYHMGGTSAPGCNYTVDHYGTLTLESTARNFYMTGRDGYGTVYRLHGGTINAGGVNSVYDGLAYWQMGGTMEITADSAINLGQAPGVLATGTGEGGPGYGDPPAANWTIPILKFSGTDTTLTMNGEVYCRFWDSTNGLANAADSNAAKIDVSELMLTALNTWHTILDASGGTLYEADYLSFVAGTDPTWDMRVLGNLVQVKVECGPVIGDITGDGYVDDKDLSCILANWHQSGPCDIAPPGAPDDYIDDKDLSLVLANWHAGCDEGGIILPEPASAIVLVIGFAAIIRRKA